MTTARAEEFEIHRPRLFGIAYRMLGSAHEAEDAVQDTWLRFDGTDRAAVERPAAWLATAVTRLCLNRLTSARARRERYPGTWLPEPVVTAEGALGPQEAAELRDGVSYALLVLLERLTPTERAVYVLREAFAYGHREISGVLGIGEANCRQLYRRAVARLAEGEARFEAAPRRQRELVESFVAAARDGDLTALERVLADDVTWWSDGGGRVSAALRPVVGRAKVVRFLLGTLRKGGDGLTYTITEVNGAAGLLVHAGDQPVGVLAFGCDGDAIARVRAVMNPDKLDFVRRQLARG
ncbi:RNA polymerase sigma-70 factor [Streptomyces sp. NPDC091281]|uniref:RNA polymerase sigma-70 factor n=1 Tax=Streptomyces sp. NPDC091281 TaxID=3365985 RepID=UPI003815DD7D